MSRVPAPLLYVRDRERVCRPVNAAAVAVDTMTTMAMTRLLEIEVRVRPITVRNARPFVVEPRVSRIIIRIARSKRYFPLSNFILSMTRNELGQ